jgi:hypothetical protein
MTRRPFALALLWALSLEYETGESELYNLDSDPFELTNVTNVPANAALKATMAARLHQLQAE